MFNFDPKKLKTKYAGDPDWDMRWRFAAFEKQEYYQIDCEIDGLDRHLRRIDEDLAQEYVDEVTEKLEEFFEDVQDRLSDLVHDIYDDWTDEGELKSRLKRIKKARQLQAQIQKSHSNK